MPRVTVRMPSAEGVAPGQTATFRLPIGRTYNGLLLGYTGVTLAQLTEIRVVANGKVFRRYAGGGAKVDLLNVFSGLNAAAGVLPIYFDRPHMRTRDGEEFTKLGTGVTVPNETPITVLTMEVDIDAAAVDPVLTLKAIQSDPAGVGMLAHVREFTYNAPAIGEYEIVDLPKGLLISSMFLGSPNITKVKIERDGFVVFERDASENSVVQLDGMRVPQAGYFVYDPTELGYASEVLATAGVQDLRIIVTMSAPGPIPVTVIYVGPLGA